MPASQGAGWPTPPQYPDQHFLFLCALCWRSQGEARSCSSLIPGSQFYHSLLCIVLQFLILRLMGRTITAVLTTFCVQMVSGSPQLRLWPPTAQGGGLEGTWGEERRAGEPPASLPFSQHRAECPRLRGPSLPGKILGTHTRVHPDVQEGRPGRARPGRD